MDIVRAIEEAMVPTLGSATLRQAELNTYLEFHPFDYMRANLAAQVGKLQMEMDKLKQWADRMERSK